MDVNDTFEAAVEACEKNDDEKITKESAKNMLIEKLASF